LTSLISHHRTQSIEPVLTANKLCASLPLEGLMLRPLSVEFMYVKSLPQILSTFLQSVERKSKSNATTIDLSHLPSLGRGGFYRSLAVNQRSTITCSDASQDLQ
jgi:hypothetical protein